MILIKSSSAKVNGFSILQAMVGMAILGIAAAGFMTFLNTAQKGQKNVQNAVDFDMFKTSLNLVFNTKACDNSLIGAGGTPLTIAWSSPPALGANLIVAGSPLPIFQVKYGSSLLAEISKSIPHNSTGGMTLSKFQVVDAIYDGEQSIGSDTYKAFSSLIEIEATKASGSLGAQKYSTKIAVRLLANTAPGVVGQVQKCGNQTAQVLTCRTIRSYSTAPPMVEDEVALCESDETRTGGGCAHYGGAYMYKHYPVVVAGRPGWYCSSGASGTVSAAYAVCCNGANTATLPNVDPVADYSVFPP